MVERVPLEITPTAENLPVLRSKREHGHLFGLK
jgi:hypothetical protein